MPKLFMASLGCAKNLVDAETMLGETLGDDFSLALEADDADVVLVNTCGFLEDARAEARDVIREFLEVKERLGGTLKVVATGCWAEREPDAVLAEFPDLDAAWGLSTPSDLREAILGLYEPDAVKTSGLGCRSAPGKEAVSSPPCRPSPTSACRTAATTAAITAPSPSSGDRSGAGPPPPSSRRRLSFRTRAPGNLSSSARTPPPSGRIGRTPATPWPVFSRSFLPKPRCPASAFSMPIRPTWTAGP